MSHHNQHQDSTPSRTDLFASETPLFVSVASSERVASRKAAPRLQVTTPADALAYVECTLGFEPRNSLAVVAFAHNQMSTVVRCDLPESVQQMARSDTPESATFMDFGMTESQELQFIALGRHIGELMAREPSTTSCLLIYLADQVTVSDQQALAVMGTANTVIAAQFALQGIPVEQSWLLHHNKLWHLRCPATTECIVQGDDVDDPRATTIYQTLDPVGELASRRGTQARRLVLPPVLAVASAERQDTQELLKHRPRVALNWLHLWDAHVQNGPAMLHSDEVAQLLAAVEHPPIRDALIASACFDLSTAIRGLIGLRKFPAQFAAVAKLYGNMSDGASVKDGLEGASQRAPDWQRIAQLERLCHQLLPLSDERSGGVLAGMLTWIEWARGRGSIAMEYVRQARKRFPTVQFLAVLEGFLNQGTVSDWATRPDAAWTPQHAA